MIDLPDDVQRSLIAWAERTNAVAELWLFGSRAKGTALSESDVDLAVSLMPAQGDHNWALGDFMALADKQWEPEITRIAGKSISFGAITFYEFDKMNPEVRSTGVMLWKRPEGP